MISLEKVRIISLIISGSSYRGWFYCLYLGRWKRPLSWSETGDKWQQHVALIDHSVCTGRATSCRNTLLRQIASCVVHNFCGKSVSKIAFCSSASRKKSNQTIYATFCGGKILLQRQRFLQKFSSIHNAICRCNASPRLCCFNLSPSRDRPSLKL